MIEEAQIVVHEAFEPDALFDFTDADLLTRKDFAEADLAFADADASAVRDGDRAIVEGIDRLCKSTEGSCGAALEF